ncbi:class I SAM-dependent methyltransferase, partial [bacterium]|nr:class I SAM-dependent methyltransferase [bacterium]
MTRPRPLLATAALLLALGSTTHAMDAAKALDAAGVKGGLVVHLGCGDGQATAKLRANESFLVHGLDTDAKAVAAARKQLAASGRHGPVSVDVFDGKTLPYIDNLVNALVADALGDVPMAEVMRVLAPRGVALIGGKKTVKPWPDDIDEWTHFLPDAP